MFIFCFVRESYNQIKIILISNWMENCVMNKLSIIIPVYNVEKYIPRCLDSILQIKNIIWECILVDDGSTDDSWNIICRYAKKYPNKFIARRKENSGVSSARNMGIDLATGDRIMFMDPDDYLLNNADELLNKAFANDCDKDIVLFDYAEVYDNKKSVTCYINKSYLKNYKTAIINLLISGTDMNFVWRTIYKADIIKKNNIRFNINMRNGEDTEFNLKYIRFAASVALVNDSPLYAYYQRAGSAARTSNVTIIDNALILLKTKLNLIKELKLELNEKQMHEMYLNIANRIFNYTCNGALNTNYSKFFKQINKYYKKPLVRKVFDNVNPKDFEAKTCQVCCALYKHDAYFLIGTVMILKFRILNKLKGKN